MRLLKGTPVYSGAEKVELVTPTGALLVTSYADEFGPIPAMRVNRIGYGAGTRDFPQSPNVLRVLIGELEATAPSQSVVVIEAEIDDMNPAALWRADGAAAGGWGARRVLYVDPDEEESAGHAGNRDRQSEPEGTAHGASIFRETTTIGVRYREMTRECLDRESITVTTELGPVRIKVARRRGELLNAAPEFDDCVRLAAEHQVADQARPGAGDEGLSRDDETGAMSESFITTPIYYINAQPHIGHAYTTMLADAVARSRRLMGDEVFFLTGTDEHGQKVQRAAEKANLPTPIFADQVSAAFRQMCRDLKASNDDFIRTTEPRHYAAAQEIWRRVQRAGDIYKGEYEGWYCTVDEIFVPEAQLVDGRCPTCGAKVERLKEESYYFRLSKYQQRLLDWYRDHPDFVQPEFRLNEVRTFVESGLQDLSISRTSFKWGIPVPDDPQHVMYVWFDALTNYLTALGFGSGDTVGRRADCPLLADRDAFHRQRRSSASTRCTGRRS